MKDIQPLGIIGTTGPDPIIIAGPCSAETRQQTLSTAQQLARQGIKIFRAGIWKPRTRPGGFEGIGAEGLQWLREVRQTTSMAVGVTTRTGRSVLRLKS